MKKINWRLLAASGQMITNIYETVQPGCAAFLLDLESFRRIEEKTGQSSVTVIERYVREQSLERMISLIASCMRELSQQRIQTALVIPAYGTHEHVLCIPHEGRDVLSESMEALALLDYRAEDVDFPYEEFWQTSHKLGNIYICTRTDARNSLDVLAEELGRGRVSLLALQRTESGSGEYSCLYGDEISMMPRQEQEEVYERIS